MGYLTFNNQEDLELEFRCPNKKCGFGVAEDYVCCPYCGQRIKFVYPVIGKIIKNQNYQQNHSMIEN